MNPAAQILVICTIYGCGVPLTPSGTGSRLVFDGGVASKTSGVKIRPYRQITGTCGQSLRIQRDLSRDVRDNVTQISGIRSCNT